MVNGDPDGRLGENINAYFASLRRGIEDSQVLLEESKKSITAQVEDLAGKWEELEKVLSLIKQRKTTSLWKFIAPILA